MQYPPDAAHGVVNKIAGEAVTGYRWYGEINTDSWVFDRYRDNRDHIAVSIHNLDATYLFPRQGCQP